MRETDFLNGVRVPVIGQGTWHLGEDPAKRKTEVAALGAGIDAGLTVIDTAEMYGDGASEELVGEAIRGRRDEVVLVSKVYPHNASRSGVVAACERSLRRLGTDRLDVYLLHWSGSIPLSETVDGFEHLRAAGKIRSWGLSNFDLDDLEPVPEGCATNQVLYNLGSRGIEFDLLLWQQHQRMPLMAYSPLGQGPSLLEHPLLAELGKWHGVTAAQIALAWVIRQPGIIAIPKASSLEHVRQNVGAGAVVLDAEDCLALDNAFPVPRGKQPLDIL
ncbi:Aldo/keto reductase [Cryobacterium flavum]|uniref:Aldo/keto reductase n=1 Tax=Cryobacterium flavum TaxID=1424659 RepID=A0A4V3IA68_9MICO|nr:aldo/keto reductase [Cryobacterium flavum]TFB82170.1 aldo/keto reductase [Cryobacterium flavum]SDN90258.1 Aldo/keto reductase [Cryobacterium flavum]